MVPALVDAHPAINEYATSLAAADETNFERSIRCTCVVVSSRKKKSILPIICLFFLANLLSNFVSSTPVRIVIPVVVNFD